MMATRMLATKPSMLECWHTLYYVYRCVRQHSSTTILAAFLESWQRILASCKHSHNIFSLGPLCPQPPLRPRAARVTRLASPSRPLSRGLRLTQSDTRHRLCVDEHPCGPNLPVTYDTWKSIDPTDE